MTTLERIRAEIEQIIPSELPYGKNTPENIRDMTLEIIDKYAEQEPTDEWQNGYDMAWEEAEVFYEQEPCRVKNELKVELNELEPCDDAISREDVLAEITRFSTEEGASVECQKLYCDVYNMPSVTQKPIECDDAIDRAEAMTEIMMFAGNVKSDEEDVYIKVSDAVQLLRELPSVRPQEQTDTWSIKDVADTFKKHGLIREQEQTGHWISHYDEDAKEGWYECDRCHTERAFNTDYCPDCGCRMVEQQESEVNK